MTLVVRSVDPYGTGRHVPQYLNLRNTITNVPQHLRSNSSYLLRLYDIYLNSVNCTKFG